MKYAISLLLAAAFACQSCGSQPADATASHNDGTPDTGPVMPVVTKIKGTYRSDFGGSPIYININYTNGWQVAGYNMHKGLRRNVKGELKADGEDWKLVLKEPGDHPYDGQFTLTFNHDFTKGKGSWTPLNSKELSAKKLDLSRGGDSRDYGTGALAYWYADENADLSFDDDGSCDLEYYAMSADSVLAKQMTELHGNWTQQGDKVTVNWNAEILPGKKNTEFMIIYRYDTLEDKIQKIADSLKGDGFALGIADM